MTKRIYLKGLFVLFLALLSSAAFAQNTGKKQLPKVTKQKTKSLADSLKTIDLDAVNITATRVLFVTKKDTTTYNLNALTLRAGAMLGDALKKFPGMEVKEGKLYYQGQAVNRLLINGVDFAKDDASKALNALPAYVVNKVKAFNLETEASRLAGYDDGSRDVVVNVLLKKKYLGTWTGEAEIGGATKKHYLAKGFANTFTDRFRVSLFGNANNVNQQLWYKGSGQTVKGYRGYFGVNEFIAPGATFFWKTKAEKGKKGYFIIEGDTDFNREDGHGRFYTESEQYLEEGALYDANRWIKDPLEYRWAGHLNFEWCPTDNLVIAYKPNLEIKKIKTNQSTLSAKWNENPFKEGLSVLDSLDQNTDVWGKKYKPAYLSRRPRKSVTSTIPTYHNLFIRQKLKSKSSISLDQYLTFKKMSSEFYEMDYYNYCKQGKKNLLINRYKDREQSILDYGAKLTFSQMIKDFRLNLSYKYSFLNKSRDDDSYRLDQLNDLYATYLTAFNLLGELPEEFNAVKAAIVDNETTIYEDETVDTHTINFMMNYKKGDFYFNLNPSIHYKSESLEHHKGAYNPVHLSRSEWFSDVDVRTGFNSSKKGRLMLFYNYRVEQPKLYQSIPLPDLSNPQYITLANPDLKNSFNHNLYLSYNKRFNAKIKGKKYEPRINFRTRFDYTENRISNKVAYDRQTGVTTTMPVNIGASYRLYTSLNTEIPLDLKQRFFLELNAGYSRSKSRNFAVAASLDEAKLDDSYNNSYRIGVGPKFRLSKFNCSLKYGFNNSNYSSTNVAIDNSKTNDQFIDASLTWNLPLGINFSTNCHYSHYSGNANQVYQPDMTMLSFSLDRAFLKDKSLTVFFRAEDVLNQKNDFYHYYSEIRRTLTRSSANKLGQYFMLGLKYRFSTKKK